VQIYEKTDVLQGAGFNADTVREQLSVVVMSFDSLKATNKENRKAYQENGYLASFLNDTTHDAILLPDYDKSALINVIRTLNPVVVVDESHNAESTLSVDMLRNLNPSFIFDLTATPRDNSNIISYVDALRLKKQNMVKLPVIVANQRRQEDVIMAALNMRRQLEVFAKKSEEKGGGYIRPIVLFQAEPKNKDDTTTFEKVKQMLLELNIPPEHIAIKTANVNELKNVDLLSRNCPVRYIITVNALKEGWDCPFAYVLATLANKSSVVDVTQILGRVLRMPYTRKHSVELLNLSYVFTASSQFQATLSFRNAITVRWICRHCLRRKTTPLRPLQHRQKTCFWTKPSSMRTGKPKPFNKPNKPTGWIAQRSTQPCSTPAALTSSKRRPCVRHRRLKPKPNRLIRRLVPKN
jgi:type III restriction enzyme